MGNRAVITTKENFENNGVGIYLHWNGGRDSVNAFLKYCELKGFRSPEKDNYGWARLCQVISNFFGNDGLSVGIDTVNHLDCDNGDNGVYFIEDWKIVGRKFAHSEQLNHDLSEMLNAIDESQLKEQQLGEYLNSDEVDVSSLKIDDVVFLRRYDGSIEKHKIIGYGHDEMVNGRHVLGLPIINLYKNGDRHNINNYITMDTIRVVKKEGEDDE